jgi:hypothetical protein
VASIKHNTHTGQWLTTFKAVWHPQRDGVFVVGSMEQPRGVSWANDIWSILRQCSAMLELCIGSSHGSPWPLQENPTSGCEWCWDVMGTVPSLLYWLLCTETIARCRIVLYCFRSFCTVVKVTVCTSWWTKIWLPFVLYVHSIQLYKLCLAATVLEGCMSLCEETSYIWRQYFWKSPCLYVKRQVISGDNTSGRAHVFMWRDK